MKTNNNKIKCFLEQDKSWNLDIWLNKFKLFVLDENWNKIKLENDWIRTITFTWISREFWEKVKNVLVSK